MNKKLEMGIFNSMFGGKNDKASKPEKKSYLNWTPLVSLNQLETIKEASKTASILIFKHSTRCGISSMVIKQFEKLFDESHQHLKVYYLDLLNNREISNEIAAKFQVTHQSPQLLVIKNGNTVAHASHYDITQIDLEKYKS